MSSCIRTHRFRNSKEPATLEAKIIFDADKLDATGTLGIARTLAYKGIVGEPLYALDEAGHVRDGAEGMGPSFFQEYHWKLKKIHEKLYTGKAKKIAETRWQAGMDFYQNLLAEVSRVHTTGKSSLELALTRDRSPRRQRTIVPSTGADGRTAIT